MYTPPTSFNPAPQKSYPEPFKQATQAFSVKNLPDIKELNKEAHKMQFAKEIPHHHSEVLAHVKKTLRLFTMNLFNAPALAVGIPFFIATVIPFASIGAVINMINYYKDEEKLRENNPMLDQMILHPALYGDAIAKAVSLSLIFVLYSFTVTFATYIAIDQALKKRKETEGSLAERKIEQVTYDPSGASAAAADMLDSVQNLFFESKPIINVTVENQLSDSSRRILAQATATFTSHYTQLVNQMCEYDENQQRQKVIDAMDLERVLDEVVNNAVRQGLKEEYVDDFRAGISRTEYNPQYMEAWQAIYDETKKEVSEKPLSIEEQVKRENEIGWLNLVTAFKDIVTTLSYITDNIHLVATSEQADRVTHELQNANRHFMAYSNDPDAYGAMTFQQAFKISPETMSLFCELAYHEIEHDNYEKGEEILVFLLHLNSGLSTIWSALAACYAKAGQTTMAIEFCSKWDQYFQNFEGIESPLPLIYQASCYKEEGNIYQAEKALKEASKRLDNVTEPDQRQWCENAIASLQQRSRDT